MAYTWSENERKWNLIGNVTGSVENDRVDETGKQVYQGKVIIVFITRIPTTIFVDLKRNKCQCSRVKFQKYFDFRSTILCLALM